jgi:hypothetical protein
MKRIVASICFTVVVFAIGSVCIAKDVNVSCKSNNPAVLNISCVVYADSVAKIQDSSGRKALGHEVKCPDGSYFICIDGKCTNKYYPPAAPKLFNFYMTQYAEFCKLLCKPACPTYWTVIE